MSSTNASTPRVGSPLLVGSRSIIEYEWANAGKPHNFICSRCRKPGNLLDCATCCRAYHVACLPAPPGEEGAGSWSCPPCQQRQEASRLVSPAADQLSCEHAKQFLSRHGHYSAGDEAFSPDFLLQLQQLIVQADLQSQTARELEQLRNENRQLQEENQRLKTGQRPPPIHDSSTYDRLRSPPVFHGHGSEAVEAQRLDAAEKSWDRIISDAF
ncbi:uncharacterized protein TRUGW13939_06568 [Talaromyces rugulosus]|uniref:PHD-type domain-containing protein n=1 Tax=Talaromyces rugulosus TaxID=121627 RepID=A0A7H8QZ68_TALRU|nr:uncharacterized protein TRUGW13939_06568 [Talaromyces rugulosus]QKX59434.1 hypothetical protein TRUGW13939_06568 [Talaromyces rugulosus]